jgi:hypothetical protein
LKQKISPKFVETAKNNTTEINYSKKQKILLLRCVLLTHVMTFGLHMSSQMLQTTEHRTIKATTHQRAQPARAICAIDKRCLKKKGE